MPFPFVLTRKAVAHSAMNTLFGRPYASWTAAHFARFIEGLDLNTEQKVILHEMRRRMK